MMIREWIWDFTTKLVADTIALVSPQRASEYRAHREIYKRSYLAAQTGGPYQLAKTSSNSGQAEVLMGRTRATARVRDLIRNNPLVSGMVLKRTTMVVGDEISAKPQIQTPEGESIKALNKELERRFYAWAEMAEIGGRSLTEICHLVENHLSSDGEILVRHVYDKGAKGNNYRLQMFETDQLDINRGTYGVDYDEFQRPMSYYLLKQHPGDLTIDSKYTVSSEKFPAADFDLIIEEDRCSQRRGISQLAAAVFKLYGVDDLEDAEMLASRSAAAFGIVVTSPLGPNYNPYTGADGTTTAPTDPNGRKLEYMQAGGIYMAAPGEEVKAFSSDRPNANFEAFTRGRKRDSAGAMGMSFESATGDYSTVNYSSARMGRIVEWAILRRRQKRIIKFLNKVYRTWLRAEIIRGNIPGLSAAVFDRDPIRYQAVVFQLAGNDGIDPLKEAKAFEIENHAGTLSRTRWCAERGRDFEEEARLIAAEKKLMEELDIWMTDPTVEGQVISTEDEGGDASDDSPQRL